MNKMIEIAPELKKLYKNILSYREDIINRLFDELSVKYPQFGEIRERELKGTEVSLDVNHDLILSVVKKNGEVIDIDLERDYETLVKVTATLNISKELNTVIAQCVEIIMPELGSYKWKMSTETMTITVGERKNTNIMDEILNSSHD